MSYPSFEIVWKAMETKKAAELAAKYDSISEAFKAFENAESIRLLASVLYPEQRVLRFEKTGSAQVKETAGLPCSAEREGYSTVGHGYVYYFHPSTLKEGDTVEWDGCQWEVMMNHLSRGSACSLAYQCLYLLEVK